MGREGGGGGGGGWWCAGGVLVVCWWCDGDIRSGFDSLFSFLFGVVFDHFVYIRVMSRVQPSRKSFSERLAETFRVFL